MFESESRFESWLWDHPETLATAMKWSSFQWVARQFSLPETGRVDLIGRWSGRLVVAEIKNRTAREADLMQALRYCKEIDYIRAASPQVPTWVDEDTYLSDWWRNRDMTGPIVIAPSFADRALRTAHLFSVATVTYRDEPPQLEHITYGSRRHIQADTYDSWEAMSMGGWLGDWVLGSLDGFMNDPMIQPRARYILDSLKDGAVGE